MKSRRKARETALQALYQCDALREWSAENVSLFFSSFVSAEPVEGEETDASSLDFARLIIAGVLEHKDYIDQQISGASTHWSLPRMARVDRNILRVATFEIAFLDDVPVSVSINEAIEIAKRFGTDDSPMFINGVLDNIAAAIDGKKRQSSDVPEAGE